MNLIQKSCLLYLFACSFFVWGLATVAYQVFPYAWCAPAFSLLTEQIKSRQSETGQGLDVLRLKPQEKTNPYKGEGLIIHDKAFKDDGFLLLSRFSRPHDQVVIELFSLDSDKVVQRWIPDLKEILRRTPNHQDGLNNWRDHRVQHPLLLAEGDLIIKNSEGPMARIRPDGSVAWTLDKHFHHSLELDTENHIVAPIYLNPALHPMDDAIYSFRDDGIAWVSLDGALLKTRSIMDLLLEAGHRELVFGVGPWEPDRFHLNDIQPILSDAGSAKKGDLALSIRNLSTVALYRPSEDRLIWVKTGPWLSQHDINILEDGRFSVFGNDVIRFTDRVQEYANKGGHAEVYVFTVKTGEVETPYSDLLFEQKVKSKTQGRSRILTNGDVFVEATDSFRLLRMSKEKMRWEFIPMSAPGILGAIHWCRYLTASEGSAYINKANTTQDI